MKFRKKPVVIEAVTFDQFVQYGRESGGNIVNGMPWSFQYNGHPITHENDQCYLIPTLEGTMRFTPDDMLITGVRGEIYPCKRDIFEATYEHADQQPAPGAAHAGYSTMQPHQQRVIDEKAELDERLAKLVAFTKTSIFAGLDSAERNRLSKQAEAMTMYSYVLFDRIAAFAPATAA